MKKVESRTIEGYSRYLFNSNGTITIINYKRTGVIRNLSPWRDKDGYLLATLIRDDGKRIGKGVHRLIATAFYGSHDNLEVNHINSVRDDNRIENLEWCTRAENIKHSYDKGNAQRSGSNHHLAKLTDKEVLDIREKFKPRIYTAKMLSEEYGVSEASIFDITRRRSWVHI